MTNITTRQARPAKQTASGFMRVNKARDSAKRKLAKHFATAIDILAATIEDPQEKSDIKVKAANIIASKYLQVLTEENNDQIRRLEAQLRLNGKLEEDASFETEDEDDTMPQLDFDTIVEP